MKRIVLFEYFFCLFVNNLIVLIELFEINLEKYLLIDNPRSTICLYLYNNNVSDFLEKKKKIFNHTYISNTAAQSGRNIRCVNPAPCIPIKISEFLVISNCFLNDTFLLYTTYIKKKDFHYTSIHFRHSYHSFNQYLFHFV